MRKKVALVLCVVMAAACLGGVGMADEMGGAFGKGDLDALMGISGVRVGWVDLPGVVSGEGYQYDFAALSDIEAGARMAEFSAEMAQLGYRETLADVSGVAARMYERGGERLVLVWEARGMLVVFDSGEASLLY